jgi:hypothetical protein
MKRSIAVISLLILSCAAAPSAAGSPPASSSGPYTRTSLCRGEPRSAGFDYWLGVWDVRPYGAPASTPASRNRITLEQDGCVLQEHWRSSPRGPGAGYTGTSFTTFDRARGVWHQTWVDNTGSVAVMEGGLDAAGDLVLHAVSMPGDPDTARRRMTFRRQADGTVRQLVERSTDGGTTWTTAIDLVYTRRRGPG